MKKKVVQRRALSHRARTRSQILSYADKISSRGQRSSHTVGQYFLKLCSRVIAEFSVEVYTER